MTGFDRQLARLTVALFGFGGAAFVALYIIAPAAHAAADTLDRASAVISIANH